MDTDLRRAQRALAWSAPEDREALVRSHARVGERLRLPPDDEPLSEWEELQEHYDDLWWHRNTPRKCGLWNHGDLRNLDFDFAPSVFKAHHTWGHTGWDDKNSKRATLRTHRDGSRRQYRLRN